MAQGRPQWPKDSWTPAVRCLGFQESETLCLPKGQLSMSEMRSPRPRVERRPWARRGNGEAWACHRLRHSLEVFLPCKNPSYSGHPAALWTLPLSEGSLTRNGSVLLLDNSKCCIYCTWKSVFLYFFLFLTQDLEQRWELYCGRDDPIKFPFYVTPQ